MVKTFRQVSGNGILFTPFYSKPVVDHVLNYLSPVHTLATYSFNVVPQIMFRPPKYFPPHN